MDKHQNKIYNVLDIARYIINYNVRQDHYLSQLKLQQILYIIQETFLKQNKERPCFHEDIYAWRLGPMIPEVYQEFKGYGNSWIPTHKNTKL